MVVPPGERQRQGGAELSAHRPIGPVRIGLLTGVAILAIQTAFLVKWAAERGEGRRAIFLADSLSAEFVRLQALESEIAELRSLNDQILALAGIHRPLPEGTAEEDHGVRGAWAFSLPTRPPRVGVLSRGFRGQEGDGGHPGVDIPGPVGVPIRAAGGGIVERAELDPHYGNVLVIQHGRQTQSLYGHNEEFLVQAGDSVWVGQSIARLGNTGRSSAPHLHFEIRVDGTAVNPAEFVREYRTDPQSANPL